MDTLAKYNYPNEFKAGAVELYESRTELSHSVAAANLGISRGTLKSCVHQARKAAGKVPTQAPGTAQQEPEALEDELARLQVESDTWKAEKKVLRAENETLSEGRAMLQTATKAAETIWCSASSSLPTTRAPTR